MKFPTILIAIIGVIALFAIGLILVDNYAASNNEINTTLMEPLYTATPTPTPTPDILVPVTMNIAPPTTMTFTVMRADDSDHTLITTDDKMVSPPDKTSWDNMMPNKIYICSIKSFPKDTGAYAVTNCSEYSYQNPSYVAYPITPTQDYAVYSDITQYYHFNDEYMQCAIGYCEQYHPSQIPPYEHIIEHFPPNTIFS